MLAISVEFLTGRYVATRYDSRDHAEWPPHPARLFSALVATHFEDESPDGAEREALQWLERQPAPAIVASDAARREVVTTYVPVNDVGMTDVDKQAAAVDEARAVVEEARRGDDTKATARATKALERLERKYGDAVKRALAPAKPGANPKAGLKVLPSHRVRQPRTFPSVTPNRPKVTFVWSGEPSEEQRAGLDSLLAQLVRLGHSSSLVAACLESAPGAATWTPDDAGEARLRTVQPGQLEALERRYDVHGGVEPRVLPARFQGYTRGRSTAGVDVPGTSFSERWLVLRRVSGPNLPMVATPAVARRLRAAMMKYCATDIPEILSGHVADGSPSQRPHLAVVPLPFVGHRHASGALLGVALVLPSQASEEDRRGIYGCLGGWEAAVRQRDEDAPWLPLNLGRAGVWELQRTEWEDVPRTLQAEAWCEPSRRWSTVTPVALDRNPGNLRSRDQEEMAAAVEKACATIRTACERIELPEPMRVEILPAPAVAAAAKASAYGPFPETEGRTRRVLTHVTIEFDRPVRGPILLGAGRYHGMGLFRPARDHG